MSGSDSTSAPVVVGGDLRILGAPNSYNFDYSGVGWTPADESVKRAALTNMIIHYSS